MFALLMCALYSWTILPMKAVNEEVHDATIDRWHNSHI